MRKRAVRRYEPSADLLDARCLLSGYTPAEITAAYDLSGLMLPTLSGGSVKGDGTGQTIALIEVYHDPNIQASLNGFDAQYGLPNINLDVINLAGSATDSGWSGEESLDVEWAHAIAPGAAIDVVEAAPGENSSQAFSDLLSAIETASAIKGVSVVSMSLGESEFTGESSIDSIFSVAGVTFVASSGDQGVVEWPSVSPNVLAVGGTTLQLSSTLGYGSELGWAGTGGGVSTGETEPSYQDGFQSTGKRSTPDVSFDANPATGVSTYFIPPNQNTGSGQWGVVGGTSVGAPAWAGIIAIADQGRELLGESVLTGATQTLPAIYALPAGDFHKVSVDSAVGYGSTNLAINTANYNTQTGLGTPIGSAVIDGLIGVSDSSNPTPPSSPPTAPANPPPPPVPPPFTVPTPIPPPTPDPIAPITYTPAPTTPVSRSPTPATPPAAAAPKAVAKKKTAVHAPKHHAKPVKLVSHHKAEAKTRAAEKADAHE